MKRNKPFILQPWVFFTIVILMAISIPLVMPWIFNIFFKYADWVDKFF